MTTLLTRLADWTQKQPDALLFSFMDSRGNEAERLDYQGFSTRMEQIASHLASHHALIPGDRVIIACPPGLDMVASLYACARAGLIGVPAPPPNSYGLSAVRYRIAHMAADCQAKALVSTQEKLDLLMGIGTAADSGDPIGEEEQAVFASLHPVAIDMIQDGAASLPDRPTPDTFFIQYTSGSTSDPKGVVVSHSNLLANCQQVVDHDKPICVSWLPQHHDMGLIGYYLFIASRGGSTYGMSTSTFIQRPALWLEKMSEHRATASSAPNFAFELCLRNGRLQDDLVSRLDLRSIRFLMAAAEPIQPTIYNRFLNRFQAAGLKPESFFVAYGLAENTLAVTNYGRASLSVSLRGIADGKIQEIEAAHGIATAVQLMSCGPALPGTKLRIVDPVTHEPVAAGSVGEVWVSGPAKCSGYWGRPGLSKEIFEAKIANNGDGASYLRTGDLGFMKNDELVICGRYKDLIIIRGQNYYPQDIEATIEAVAPQLRRSCIAAFAIDEGHATRVAVVAEVKSANDLPKADDIFRAARIRHGLDIDLLALVPPRSLPKTSSGKLMRFRAREMLIDGEFELLSRITRERTHEEDTEFDATGLPVFEGLRLRYKLEGTETKTLEQVGIDSLDIVTIMHELQTRAAEKGARKLAELIDLRLIQEMTVATLFRIVGLFTGSPEIAIVELRDIAMRLRASQIEAERQRMRDDRVLGFTPPSYSSIPLPAARDRNILLTGATGFLGAYLLQSLLTQTQARISVMVRAETAEQGFKRIFSNLESSGFQDRRLRAAIQERVQVICSDLEKPRLGLDESSWTKLADDIDTIYHNGAIVNYLFTYERMRAANVLGTREMLRLAATGRPKAFNHISTTFMFGWATKDVLYETDNNDEMQLLDFGYSQSKWVSEQIVLDARRQGLMARIFRPALITPSASGGGSNFDITIRLLAFMIKHGLGVDAMNQVSFMPVDVTANNIVAIAEMPQTMNGTFHVTRDDYANMVDIVRILSERTGRRFEFFPLKGFVPEVIRRCTPNDILFPLVDFLVGSIDSISSMEFKRYDSSAYMTARNASGRGMPDPSLEDTVKGILSFIRRKKLD